MLTAHTSEADIMVWILSSVDKNRKSCRLKKKNGFSFKNLKKDTFYLF